MISSILLMKNLFKQKVLISLKIINKVFKITINFRWEGIISINISLKDNVGNLY